LDWSGEGFTLTNVIISIIANANQESAVTRGCKLSLNFFKFKSISPLDGIPGAGSVLKFRTLYKVIKLSIVEKENDTNIFKHCEKM
jgi:hypothetical protein